MSDFTLGQRVQYTDRLVRVSLHLYGGGPRIEELLQEALDLMGVSRKRGVTTHKGLFWKLWVPDSFARKHNGGRGLSMLNYSSTPATGEGFITQRATLQQGGVLTEGYDEPAIWMDHGTTRAYKVAFDINRTPVHVLPEHITPMETP